VTLRHPGTAREAPLAYRYGARAPAVHADITDAGELDALREALGRLGVGSLAVLEPARRRRVRGGCSGVFGVHADLENEG